MKYLSLSACVIFLFISLSLANELFVIHGSFRENQTALGILGACLEKFDIIEINRGSIPQLKDISVAYYFPVDENNWEHSVEYPPEYKEKDAILLVLLVGNDEAKERYREWQSVSLMYAIGHDREMSVLPYSKELWERITAMTDEEILGKLLTEQEAWKCSYDFAIQKGAHPKYIYASTPWEYKRSMKVRLYFWKSGELYKYDLYISPLQNVFVDYGLHGIEPIEMDTSRIESFLASVSKYHIAGMPFRLGPDGLPVRNEEE